MAQKIVLKKVEVHNLKKVDLTLTPNQLIVFTGVSGSGKSSLAFDTIYTEGQRRYIESLSPYARRHLGDMQKPKAEAIEGISPTIAIEQKTAGRSPRSTVGTMTGIYDFLRILYARIGVAHCPVSKEVVSPQSAEHILRHLLETYSGKKVILLSPFAKGKKGQFKDEFAELMRKGFTRVRLDGNIVEVASELNIDGKIAHDVEIVIDRLKVQKEDEGRIAESVTMALEEGAGQLIIVDHDSGNEELFSQHAYSEKSGLSYGPLSPQDFSFNHPSGMCPKCNGLGSLLEFDLEKIIDPNLSIAEGCCSIASSYNTVRYGNIFDNLARIHKFSVKTPWKKLSDKAKDVFLNGINKKWVKMQFVHPQKKQSWIEYVSWKGVLEEARKRYQEASSDRYRHKMEELMEEMTCPSCKGARIGAYAAATTVGKKTIHQLTEMPLSEAYTFFSSLKLTGTEKKIGEELVKEVTERLYFLNNVGLHYLALERTAPTLSGGESQRVRLASQIGSGLSKATYVLDEPSIGLHPRDNTRLLTSLRALCSKGNTVIVVEHDEETILEADHIVDVGPYAGKDGGEILVSGSLKELLSHPTSVTGAFLTGKKTIPIPKKRRKAKGFLEIVGAEHHNLKKLSAKVPLSTFCAVTGVSGSGKSSLVSDILHPALSNLLHNGKMKVGKHETIRGTEAIDKVIAIDQSPIGKTPRSNPATYVKLFDPIRDLFTKLPEAEVLGLVAGHFSFNVKEGSCPHCSGMGMVKVDMDFMDDEWVRCKECRGKRFDQKVLSVLYKEKSIYDVLEMTVDEALEFFEPITPIRKKLTTLKEVGLGYMKIGQSSPTLSGGEAQRIKLAKELTRPSTGQTLYILDEPTTGLHFYDIEKLVRLLHSLVEKNNTVLVIEHNMDLVKTADWILDIGPEGGAGGGELVAKGTPEQIAKQSTPTGKAVHTALFPSPIEPKEKIEQTMVFDEEITVEKAEQNTLKGISATVPHDKITVCTGPSGSGKSSFAFETVYAEGQRRYTESLSAYARQYVKQCPKPKIDRMDGLLAAIAIEQKAHAGNPRSTIGTMTEIYDYLRILYAYLGVAYCPETKEKLETISKEFVQQKLLSLKEKTRVQILAPLELKEDFTHLKQRLLKEGFLRLRLNDQVYDLDEEIPFDKGRKNEAHVIVDRLVISPKIGKRLYDAIDVAANMANDTLVANIDGEDTFFNLAFAAPSTGKSYPKITPHTFSFNTASGMCFDCMGLGFQYGANLAKHRPIMRMSPYALMLKLWKEHALDEPMVGFEQAMDTLGIDLDTPLEKLPPKDLNIILGGSDIPIKQKGFTFKWQGLGPVFSKLAKSATTDLRKEIAPWVDQIVCPTCQGARLNPLARHVKIDDLSISEFCALALEDAKTFIDKIGSIDPLLEETLHQLKHKLSFLNEIGLEYLSLDRSAPTLSGGETQRIRLARQLGSYLTGCLYVLDEPTIGLHPHNNVLLNNCLKKLCSLGNTLLLVEHDPLTVEIADYIYDFGPGAGKQGGNIVAQGTLAQIKKDPKSLTGAYLSGKKEIATPKKRRQASKTFKIEKAHIHNLKNLSLELPVGVMTAVTGVSGSGKSTLIQDLLRPAMQQALAKRQVPDQVEYAGATFTGISAFNKMLVMDQNPIGHTNRADVSTFTDLSTPLRGFFAELPEAKTRGLKPKNFSFNHLKGMCTKCWGLGKRKVEMQFLPPVQIVCDACHGFRLNPVSLQVKYKGKHFGHILQMSVDEALEWIAPIPKVIRILETLQSVGLGYLQLGQEIATLSGGEAQRLRLAKELAKRGTGKTLYLLDEPTIGLHYEDITLLLKIFHSLVEKKNTVILIEHNQEVIKNCDYLIDMGPGAGSKGGNIVATGTPEEIVKNPQSLTGKYLSSCL